MFIKFVFYTKLLLKGQRAKQIVDRVGKKGRSMLAIRRIRSFEEDFDIPEFEKQSLEVYIKAHTLLAEKKLEELHDYVTEYAYPQMTFKTELTTIKWQYISSLEPPVVAHVRTQEMMSKNNLFAQITVRFHTRQILAIYDRFGRLMHGSDAIVKDVLEYVVFEKHIASVHGLCILIAVELVA